MAGFVYEAGSIEATADIDRTLFNNALTQMQKDAEAWASQVFTVGFNAELNQASVAVSMGEIRAAAGKSVSFDEITVLKYEPQVPGEYLDTFTAGMAEIRAAAGKTISWAAPTVLRYAPQSDAAATAAMLAELAVIGVAGDT